MSTPVERPVGEGPGAHPRPAQARLIDARDRAPNDADVQWALFTLRMAVGRVRDAVTHAETAYRLDPLRPPNVTAHGIALVAAGDIAGALALLEDAVERWPDDPAALAIAAWLSASTGEMPRVDRLMARHQPDRYPPTARAVTERTLFIARAYRHPGPEALEETHRRVEQDVVAGCPRFSLVALWANLGGDLDVIYDTVTPATVAPLCQPDGRLAPLDGLGHLFFLLNVRLRHSPRFVELCRALGLVDYWRTTGTRPDCVDEVAAFYDFVEVSTSGGRT